MGPWPIWDQWTANRSMAPSWRSIAWSVTLASDTLVLPRSGLKNKMSWRETLGRWGVLCTHNPAIVMLAQRLWDTNDKTKSAKMSIRNSCERTWENDMSAKLECSYWKLRNVNPQNQTPRPVRDQRTANWSRGPVMKTINICVRVPVKVCQAWIHHLKKLRNAKTKKLDTKTNSRPMDCKLENISPWKCSCLKSHLENDWRSAEANRQNETA